MKGIGYKSRYTTEKLQGKMRLLYKMTLPMRLFLFLVACIFYLISCTNLDLYEKNVTIPKFKWHSSYQPEFDFTITDTTSFYQLFFVIRHNEKYSFNNIWFNLYYQPPGDTMHKALTEVRLATNDGWLGSGMDDIYEHREKLADTLRLKAGNYHFKLEHMMREDPLQNVMSVGLRLEKKP
jgi:gliding motility-associated lipoprotein GldH